MTPTEINEADPAAFAFWLRFWGRVIAALEVLGGLCGICGVTFGRLIGTSRVVLLLAFVPFVAGAWGGVLLALGRRGGVAVSLVIQALQLFQVSMAGLLYSFVCGLQFVLGFRLLDDGPNIGLGFYLPSRFSVFVNPPPEAMLPGAFTGLNVAALLAIICLLFLRSDERKSAQSVGAASAAAAPKTEGVWPPAPEQ